MGISEIISEEELDRMMEDIEDIQQESLKNGKETGIDDDDENAEANKTWSGSC